MGGGHRFIRVRDNDVISVAGDPEFVGGSPVRGWGASAWTIAITNRVAVARPGPLLSRLPLPPARSSVAR